jgi:hypothetical protein
MAISRRAQWWAPLQASMATMQPAGKCWAHHGKN